MPVQPSIVLQILGDFLKLLQSHGVTPIFIVPYLQNPGESEAEFNRKLLGPDQFSSSDFQDDGLGNVFDVEVWSFTFLRHPSTEMERRLSRVVKSKISSQPTSNLLKFLK